MNKELVTSILGGFLRYALAGVFAWMVERGIATQDQVALLITGASGFLALLVWMGWNKVKARVELLTALTAQPGTSVNELKEQVKAGVAVPASTPNDATPRVVVDAGSVKPPRGNMGSWLLPLLLASSLVAVPACAGLKGTVNPNPPVDQVQAVRNEAAKIAVATREAAKLALAAHETAQAAYDAKLIPAAAMQKINDAAIDASREGLKFLDFAEQVTTDPSLRTTAAALLKVFDGLIAALTDGGQSGAAIRAALAALYTYLGVQ